MLHAGLDLSRKRLDVCLLSDQGELVDELTAFPDAGGLKALAHESRHHGEPVCAVIESMTGARFVHDTLEPHGWSVEIADAQKVKGLAPLAVKTDRIDARVLAVLSQRDLVPAIWLPDPRVRQRARARPLSPPPGQAPIAAEAPDPLGADQLRAPLPGHRSLRGRGPELLARARDPRALAREHRRHVALIDYLEAQIAEVNAELREGDADHPYVPQLLTRAGDGLGARLHDRRRDRRDRPLRAPTKLTGYTGLCPRVVQSGESDRRGPLSKHGPTLPALGAARGDHARPPPPGLLRALPAHQAPARQAARRQGRPDRHRPQADDAIWHMLTRNE